VRIAGKSILELGGAVAHASARNRVQAVRVGGHPSSSMRLEVADQHIAPTAVLFACLSSI
jgi:hypothetical protein